MQGRFRGHQAAVAIVMLGAMSGAAEPPRESPTLTTSRRLVPTFGAHESRHFILLSDAGDAAPQRHLERLELTHDAFAESMAHLQIAPSPLRHKLVGLLFTRRADFNTFARAHDGIAAGWMFGYYAPPDDRIVFFRDDGEDGDDFARDRAVATTIHEASHQLLFHTGVQTIHVQYPLWVCEGLATCFETTTPDEPFGLVHAHPPRQRRFRRLLREDRLLPLNTLVALDALPDARPETIEQVYHQSYALVAWLVQNRPEAFRVYLERMRAEPPGRPTAVRHRALFHTAFGDIRKVERAWLQDERRALAASPPLDSAPDAIPTLCTHLQSIGDSP